MTPIERACIAVIDNLREQGDLMSDCGDPEWAQVDGAFRVEPVVRAVLKVMREPSEAMIVATDDHDNYWQYYADGRPSGPVACYVAMIDAALQEG